MLPVATSAAPAPRAEARPAPVVAVVAVVALVVAVVLAHWTVDHTLTADLLYVSLPVGAGAWSWWWALRPSTEDRTVHRLVALGISLSALGDAIWVALTRAGRETDVSAADLAWWASYVALCVAMVAVLRRSRSSRRAALDAVLDVSTIAAVGVAVVWGTSVEAIVGDGGLPWLTRAVWASYPVADAVLLALVLRVLASPAARQALRPIFAIGVCVWLTVDVAYLHVDETGVAGDLMDAAWMVAPVLMAVGLTRPRPAPRPPGPEARPQALELLVAVGPLLVPPMIEVVADLQGRPDRPMLLSISMLVLVTLALARFGLLLSSERRAHVEMTRARDVAIEASEAKSLFLANMGHEIRTPLTTVLGVAELLDDTELDATQRQLLARLDRSGVLLKDLVERVLDFSSLARGEVTLRPTEFAPADLVADLVDAYAARADRSLLVLSAEVDPRTPAVVRADLTRVFQVLTNLLDNAFKFTDAGSVRLEVGRVEERRDLVRFAVHDTGIGISPEDQTSVFEVFRQVDGSMTRTRGGSGLGLAICDHLATAMGGAVTVHSRPGQGSSFELRLPVSPDGATPTADRADAPVVRHG